MQPILAILSLAGILSSASAFACDNDNSRDATGGPRPTDVVAAAPSTPAAGDRLETWNRMEAAWAAAADGADATSIPYINDANGGCE